ncbi:MAG: hypothetical protein ACE5D4_03150 [Thermodesulfobacteriota bacterium]
MPAFLIRCASLLSLLLIFTLCLPFTAYGDSLEDPYAVKILRGDVIFKYARADSGFSSDRSTSSEFEQIYSFILTGNIWDPRFLIYDATLSFDDITRDDSGSRDDSTTWKYGLSTTLFPRFRFPLNLFADFSRNDSRTVGTFRENDSDTYGMRLTMNFRRLPVTTVEATTNSTRRLIDGALDDDESRNNYSVGMKKSIGPTKNELRYEVRSRDEPIDSVSNESSFIQLKNRTELPMNSDLSVSLNHFDSQNSSPNSSFDTSSNIGFVSLESQPGEHFRQRYYYSFIESNFEDEQNEDQQFNGTLDYSPSDRFSTNMSLDLSETTSNSSSIDTNSKSANVNIFSQYHLTERWSTTGSVLYTSSERMEGDPLTGRGERRSLSVQTGLNYRRAMEWATFSAAYSAGYKETSTDGVRDGEALTQSASTGLSGIDIYFLSFHVNYNRRWDDSFQGQIDLVEETYAAGFGTRGIRYFELSGDYSFHRLDDFDDERDEDDTSVSLGAASTFLRRTTLAATGSYSDINTPGLGVHEEYQYDLSAEHERIILAGQLYLFAGQNFTKVRETESTLTVGGGEALESQVKSSTVKAAYNKKITRRLRAEFRADRKWRNRDEAAEEIITTMTVSAKYNLRSWLVTGNFHRSTTESTTLEEDYVANRFMLTLSRSFMLVFF